ncbi:helix-turn-helix domain-containing protein [Mechercharimyces sp. CAU 1602]|uniref:helix-turn-helix domain-containing protein n=1 Tax=Mechercharimyces sp. CAU 1602 TaxID=2973933 RepID=UPI0037C531AF
MRMEKERYIPRIKELRTQKGIMASWIADKIGVSSAAMSKWEKGTSYPTYPYLIRLSRVLGVTIEELYEEQKNDHP